MWYLKKMGEKMRVKKKFTNVDHSAWTQTIGSKNECK